VFTLNPSAPEVHCRHLMKKQMLLLFSFILIDTTSGGETIRAEKFENPFCMIDRGDSEAPFAKKLTTLKRYQRRISRKSADFHSNKLLERELKLHGSAKWITYRFLKARQYTETEIEFAYFAMTLFGEARNLDEESMGMVARVINNRRRGRSYAATVTEMAQFSTWYYRNQKDNVILLCPQKKQTDNWRRAVEVAKAHFNKKDDYLGSTHYFSPYNMVPRFRPPIWARGKKAVSYGGHIFLVDKKKYKGSKKITQIPTDLNRIRAVRGEIIL